MYPGKSMTMLYRLIAIFFLSTSLSSGQSFEPLALTKPQPSKSESINLISFTLPASRLTQLHNSKGEKLTFSVPSIIINGDTIKTKHIHIRGQTSSYYRRKSFNVKVVSKATFHSHNDTLSLNEFYAVSMNMDRNYIRNKIAYDVLVSQNVLIPLNCYSNLVINGNSEGLYMIFYPPDELALKKYNSPLVIRRGYQGSIDKIHKKDLSNQELKRLKEKFLSIYKIVDKFNGENLYNELYQVLDLNSYFNWIAFNDLFQNGDYADEVYFMWDQSKSKFQIIPWDFDDLLQSEPHEGAQKRKEELNNKLIFSLEDKLDVAMAKDLFLYKEYLKGYDKFLNQLTPKKLEEILNNVFQEVYPYYLDQDIISQSQFDQYGLTSLEKLETDLSSIYQVIGAKMITLPREIKALINE